MFGKLKIYIAKWIKRTLQLPEVEEIAFLPKSKKREYLEYLMGKNSPVRFSEVLRAFPSLWIFAFFVAAMDYRRVLEAAVFGLSQEYQSQFDLKEFNIPFSIVDIAGMVLVMILFIMITHTLQGMLEDYRRHINRWREKKSLYNGEGFDSLDDFEVDFGGRIVALFAEMLIVLSVGIGVFLGSTVLQEHGPAINFFAVAFDMRGFGMLAVDALAWIIAFDIVRVFTKMDKDSPLDSAQFQAKATAQAVSDALRDLFESSKKNQ